MSQRKWLLPACVLWALPLQAAIYKCVDADGRTSFQGLPCEAPLKQVFKIAEPGDTVRPTVDNESSEQLEAETLVVPPVTVPPGRRFVISTNLVENTEWLEVLSQVRSERAGQGDAPISVYRVWQAQATPETRLQAAIGKQRVVNGDSRYGGSRYLQVQSGDFVVVEHREREGTEPLLVGSALHGSSKIQLPVPPAGQLEAVGDIVLAAVTSARHTGNIELRLSSTERSSPPDTAVLGTQTVGGSIGKRYPCEVNRCRIERLAPGYYWVGFPGSGEQWPVNLQVGETAVMEFEVLDDGQIRLSSEIDL